MIPKNVIALTGGTGFVGQSVVEEACRRGMALRALARREQPACAGVEWVHGDLADRAALAALVSGADAVLHVAGVVNAPKREGFHLGNVNGTEALVDAALAAGVRRFVLVSSLAAREPGLSDYGKSKRLAEEVVQTSGLDWTIVRPPAIYGPRDRELFELFRAAKRFGIVPVPPRGRASIIHVADLARLLLELVASGGEAMAATHERIFEPDDGREGGWSHAKLGDAIGRSVGRKVRVPHMPAAILKLAARLDRLFRRSRARLTPDRASYMIHPDWVSRRDKAPPDELWRARIPTRDGLTATARWYREQGWL